MNAKVLLSVFVLSSLLASCNMPAAQPPVTQPPGDEPVSLNESAIATAVALTTTAQLTENPGSAIATFTPVPTFTPLPTQCNPTVTSTVNANVRSGPGTAYDIIGALTLGQSATIVGRNEASTWWYINYPVGSSGSGWIAGSVVSASCVPSVVQVVAAPPLPTVVVVDSSSSDDSGSDGSESESSGSEGSGSTGMPDLVPVGMAVSPNPATQGHAVHIQVGVRNAGDAPSGSFTMQWWATHALAPCQWTIPSLAPGESANRTCSYTYGGWNPAYDIKLVIDSGNAVTESNEGNNSMARKLKVNNAP